MPTPAQSEATVAEQLPVVVRAAAPMRLFRIPPPPPGFTPKAARRCCAFTFPHARIDCCPGK